MHKLLHNAGCCKYNIHIHLFDSLECEMKQLNLFDYNPDVLISKQPTLKMSKDALEQWKGKIFQHQQQILTQESSKPQQLTLFDLDSHSTRFNANNINPFSLTLHNSEFYEHKPKQHDDSNCIYFIIDNNLPLLLYIGESQNSPTKRFFSRFRP